jgi:prepilin-type processing-associated H-X9-DG protein
MTGFYLKDGPNSPYQGTYPPSTHICPSDTSTTPDSIVRLDAVAAWGGGNYVANIQSLNHWYASLPGNGLANNPGITQPRPFTHPKVAHITDGMSNTVAFAERYAVCPTEPAGRTHWLGTVPARYDSVFAWNRTYGQRGTKDHGVLFDTPQIAPAQEECNPDYTQTAHPGTMNIVMMDGSVQTVAGDVDVSAWKLMILPRDGGDPAKYDSQDLAGNTGTGGGAR